MFGQQSFSCLACGVDLWDVDRSVRAGAAVLCGHCVLSMADQLRASDATGQIDVVVQPRVSGAVPDADAVADVTAAFYAVFSGDAERRDAALLDATVAGAVLEHAQGQYANMNPRFVVNRVRFPESDRAEVRFRFVLHGGPGGIDGQGEARRRDGRWLVTAETVLGIVPGGAGRIGFERTALLTMTQREPIEDEAGDPQAGDGPPGGSG